MVSIGIYFILYKYISVILEQKKNNMIKQRYI